MELLIERLELSFPVDFLKHLVNTVSSPQTMWSGVVEQGCFDSKKQPSAKQDVLIKTAVCDDGVINISFAQLNLIILKRCCNLKFHVVDKRSDQVNEAVDEQFKSNITTSNDHAEKCKTPMSRRGRKRGKAVRELHKSDILTEPRRTRSASHSQGIPKHLLYPGEDVNVDHEPENPAINDPSVKDNNQDDTQEAGLEMANGDDAVDSDVEHDTDVKSNQTDLYVPRRDMLTKRWKKPVNLKPVRIRKNKKWDMTDMPLYERRARNRSRDAKCKYCSKKLCDYTGVYAHVSKYHSKEEDVQDYLKDLKGLQVVKCSTCELTFPSRHHLHTHEDREHLKVGEVMCTTCKKSYKNIQSYRNHVAAVHCKISNTNMCHLCPAKFKWASTLKHHMEEIHEGKKDYQCKVCDKRFYKKAHVSRHERIHGLDASKKILCPECGKAFWFNCNLERHRKVMHQQVEEKFHCSYCGRGFCQKASMITHVQLFHFNMHAFVCKTCDIGFTRSKHLQRHMTDAHNQVGFIVDESSKKMSKYHRTTDDLFYCTFCSDSFCYKSKLVEHMHHSHAASFPYACDECKQGFLEKDFLLYHQKMAHGAKIDDSDYENKEKQTERRLRDKTRKVMFETKKETKATKSSVADTIKQNSELLEGRSYDSSVTIVSQEVDGTTVEEVDGAAVVSDSAAASLLVEVASGGVTYHYVIQAPEDGLADGQDIANLILEADKALQTAEQTIIEAPTGGTIEQEEVIPMEQESGHILVVQDVINDCIVSTMDTDNR